MGSKGWGKQKYKERKTRHDRRCSLCALWLEKFPDEVSEVGRLGYCNNSASHKVDEQTHSFETCTEFKPREVQKEQ